MTLLRSVVTTSSCSLLLIYRPRKNERLSWPGWLTYSGRFTHISGHPSAVGRAQDSESSRSKTNVLPLRTEPTMNTIVWKRMNRVRFGCKLAQVSCEISLQTKGMKDQLLGSGGQRSISHEDWWRHHCRPLGRVALLVFVISSERGLNP